MGLLNNVSHQQLINPIRSEAGSRLIAETHAPDMRKSKQEMETKRKGPALWFCSGYSGIHECFLVCLI
ncbi:hypothetical protein ERICIV_01135 [Paenibacillus larvae subsp. larvae]|uniref:Uncharacterized protein n=1 Tax=Paenibacillus larvae subsp. larvae TaxID=147375 RepID=A0A2L1TXH6_9BACL|nr:hypothetical protein ERICIII_01114 [Paenibacillus larvae subsp. larvae]AVF30095.1 hypothetical protein ERICIV_01135 [Paenibacillus larvae subsp. larvae]